MDETNMCFQDIRRGSGLLRFLLTLSLMLAVSCTGPMPSDEDWHDTSRSMWVTIRSIPSGAEVHGVSGNKPGRLLGRTPITVKFWKSLGTGGPVLWQCPNREAPMDEVLEYRSGRAIFQTADMPGRRLSPNTNAPIWRAGLDGNTETAQFHCIVVMDGYKAQLLQDEFRGEVGHTGTPHVLRGQHTYDIVLQPLKQ